MDTICYWDEVDGRQKERPCTTEEQEDLDAMRCVGLTVGQHNSPILAALGEIDVKTPRAVREALITGDNSRVQALEDEAAALRLQLRKD